MQSAVVSVFLALILFSCKLDLFPEQKFEESGKIKGRIILASTGQPVPGVFVQVYSTASTGWWSTKADNQYSYSDENGYFQIPKMTIGSSGSNELIFYPDSIRWQGYLIAPSGYRNEQKENTEVYEIFKPTLLKLKVNYDTAKFWPPYESYNVWEFNKNRFLNLYGSDLNEVGKDSILIVKWFPELRRPVRLDFTPKQATLPDMKYCPISNEVYRGDTCYATVSIP